MNADVIAPAPSRADIHRLCDADLWTLQQRAAQQAAYAQRVASAWQRADSFARREQRARQRGAP